MNLFVSLYLFPYLITQLVLCDHWSDYYDEWKKKILFIGTPVNILLNSAALFLIFGIVYQVRNPLTKLLELFSLQCSYQDFGRMGLVLLISMMIAFLFGIGGYYLVNREFPIFSKARKGQFLLCVIILLIPVISLFSISHIGEKNLEISEICRKTSTMTLDDLDEPSDAEEAVSYIVITNKGSFSFEADGIYLSDNEDGENSQLVANVVMPADTSYTIRMSSEDSLNIKKKGGSEIFLFDKFDNLIDSRMVPALLVDESYKLVDKEWQIVNIAPEAEETTFVNAPVFSAEGGFYPDAFYLDLTSDKDTRIYYTLDGSIPSEASQQYIESIYVYDKSSEPNQYRNIKNVTSTYLENWTEPEVVDKAFIVRAIAVDASGNSSDIVTMTYFVNLDQYKKRTVLSLVADPEDLFGDEGIYVTGSTFDAWYSENLELILQQEEEKKIELNALKENGATEEEIKAVQNKQTLRNNAPIINYLQHGEAWERAANIELFDSDKNFLETLNQTVGIRIQGAASRELVRKRFSVYARKMYNGSNVFETELFKNKRTHSIVLREGFDNAFSQMLVADRERIAVQQSFPVDVFLNGEYWYTTYVMEKYNDTYFAETYELTKENVLSIKPSWRDSLVLEEKDAYNQLKRYINMYDLGQESNYHEFCELVDIQSFIDFMCTNLYVANCDLTMNNNVCIWKTYIKENKTFGDARWRWGLYDMDLVRDKARIDNQLDTNAEINNYTMSSYGQSHNDYKIFADCIKNKDFCQQFVITLMDMINTNFSIEVVSSLMDEWGISIEDYENGFYLNRAYYVKKYTVEEFGLKGNEGTVTLSSNRSGNPIQLNTITPNLTTTWSGTYFTDYPITVTAVYENFDYWEITANGQTRIDTDTSIEVDVEKGGIEIHAIFK